MPLSGLEFYSTRLYPVLYPDQADKSKSMRIPILTLFIMCFSSCIHAAGESIDYQVDGQTYEGYFIPGDSDSPFILLIHDWDGLNDYEIKRAQMLAAQGYSVFAADLFGKNIRPTEDKDKRQHTGELYKDRQKMRNLMNGATAAAQQQGANVENGVAMGYCFGGAAILELARAGATFKGFASFHGGLATPTGQDYNQTKGAIMVFHGTADTAISMADFASLANELEQAEVRHEMISYGGAPHSFTHFGSERYRKDADEKSWARFLAFLKEVLNG